MKGSIDDNYKKKFINSCDAMIYARSLGESFGLSCGEFALENKKIISYKFNRHRSHCYNISSKYFKEYSSYKSLIKIILNFKKNNLNYKNKYKSYSHKKVIKVFQNKFFQNKNLNKFNFIDYLTNYISFIKIGYYYLRHKLYNHYFNYFEMRFLKKNL